MRRSIAITALVLVLLAVMLQPFGIAQAQETQTQYVYTSQPDAAAGKDVDIGTATSTYNRGVALILAGGEPSSIDAVNRILIQFDLSTIPGDAQIVSATLSLWAIQDYSLNARTLRAYRALKPWLEGTGNGTADTGNGATWITYDGVANWDGSGASSDSDVEDAYIGSVNMPAGTNAGTVTATQHDIVLSPDAIQDWVSGAMENHGLLLRMDTENNDRWGFASSDNATAEIRPRLVVVYTLPEAEPTPTPTITPTPAYLQEVELSSGNTFLIERRITYGDSAVVIAALIVWITMILVGSVLIAKGFVK